MLYNSYFKTEQVFDQWQWNYSSTCQFVKKRSTIEWYKYKWWGAYSCRHFDSWCCWLVSVLAAFYCISPNKWTVFNIPTSERHGAITYLPWSSHKNAPTMSFLPQTWSGKSAVCQQGAAAVEGWKGGLFTCWVMGMNTSFGLNYFSSFIETNCVKIQMRLVHYKWFQYNNYQGTCTKSHCRIWSIWLSVLLKVLFLILLNCALLTVSC